MSYNYEWQFNPLESYPTALGQTDVVFKVHWQCYVSTGSLETSDYYSDFSVGVVPVTYNTESFFIPFNQLTREVVYSWVETAMGIEEINKIQQELVDRIESKIHPTVLIQNSPWL